jgi:hypothetical protein
MQQRPLARVAPTRVSLRPLFGLIALLALVWTYRAAVLDRVRGRTMQTRQPSQFEPTRV